MKYCINCGEKIEVDADFCTKCGHKQPNLGIILAQDPHSQFTEQEQVGKKKKKYSKEEIIDAIGCIIIIAGIVVLIFLYAFFKEWIAFLWPIILAIIVISCVIRLLGAGIVELIQRRKDRKHSQK
ncbi:MAG: zinc-ribbon domain-containing protein [Promethearchaeota archaeon]